LFLQVFLSQGLKCGIFSQVCLFGQLNMMRENIAEILDFNVVSKKHHTTKSWTLAFCGLHFRVIGLRFRR